MPTRYTFGGDEHLFVECSDEMSLEAFFKSLSMANGVKESCVKGITEICPANASRGRCRRPGFRRYGCG